MAPAAAAAKVSKRKCAAVPPAEWHSRHDLSRMGATSVSKVTSHEAPFVPIFPPGTEFPALGDGGCFCVEQLATHHARRSTHHRCVEITFSPFNLEGRL